MVSRFATRVRVPHPFSMSVIVTNAKSRIAYNVVRSLGRKGVAVYAADFIPFSMSFASRFVKGHFVYPSPFREPDAFLQCIVDQIRRVEAEVLIPVFEETFLIAKHKERVSQDVALVIPDYSQILIAHNKDVWEGIARRLDIPVPRTCAPEDIRQGKTTADSLRYPVLIKPKQGGGAWGIKEVSSAKELETRLAEPAWEGKAWNRFFVQEKIAGETHCVAMLFNSGQVRAKVAYRQLRDYPSTGGQATLRVSIRSDRAEHLFQRLLEDLKWHGPCQADFVIDRNDGTPYLIDINPRLWGSLTQAIASGVDFPYLIYRIAKDGDVAPVTSFKTGVVTRWMGGDLVALPSRLRRSHQKLRVLSDFMFPATPSTLYDDFTLTDPLPFVAWSADAVYRAIKFRSTQAASHDSLDGTWE